MADLLDMDTERQPLHAFAEKAYLDYAMYVILDRALPHVGDGLKPVQRRIIYAMSELGLSASSKPKKAARTVGDVIGKFHPHGDSACYEAMVIMAQDFTYRYPLIFGQGNWGTVDDPKSFAAMRYTESKLTAYSATLLAELGQGTVDWQPNFDGTLNEPKTLPARLPNILLNGGSGIAVGMATDIPPHNLKEVAAAAKHLLKNPQATTQTLCEYIPAPDFPTGAEIITPQSEIVDIYKTGRGSIKQRACYEQHKGEIVVTELPYQVSGSKVLEQIAKQMQAKKLPMVTDLRDESDHENPVRIVIVPRSNRVDVERLMAHLFATTNLEKNIRVNFNVIGLNGAPQVKGLQQLLTEWLAYRVDTVTRRLKHRLQKVEQRLHILQALLVAFLNIDDVIAIIRYEDEPKAELIKRFQLSDMQAEAILNLRLRHLMKLEEMKIRGEQDQLEKEYERLQALLGSKTKLQNLIAKELDEDVEKYADPRRTQLVERQAAQALTKAELMPSETVTVALSKKGWIRAAKGHNVDARALNYRNGDDYLASACGRNNQPLILMGGSGRCYTLEAYKLASARSQGEPVSSMITPPDGAQYVGMVLAAESTRCVLASNDGYGFIGQVADFISRNKRGKAVLSVSKNAKALGLFELSQQVAEIAVVTAGGYLLCIDIKQWPVLKKGKGNKLIKLSKDDQVVAITPLDESQTLIVHSGKRHMNLTAQERQAYRGNRNTRGKKLPRGFTKVYALETQ